MCVRVFVCVPLSKLRIKIKHTGKEEKEEEEEDSWCLIVGGKKKNAFSSPLA